MRLLVRFESGASIVIALVIAASPAVARQCDGFSAAFAANGVDDDVHGFTVHDDGGGPALYVAGRFAYAGGRVSRGIARWDGSGWSPLGEGLYGNDPLNDYALSFAEHDDGSGPALYVGGRYTLAGGVSAGGIARWRAGAWEPVGAGVVGAIEALAVYDDGSGAKLYAGGDFSAIDGVNAFRLACWDGASWSAVDGMVGGDPLARVSALRVHDDGSGPALFIGGRFLPNGASFETASVVRWNGTWTAISFGQVGEVRSLAVFDGGGGPVLHAGGSFSRIGPSGAVNASCVASWNGATWSALGSGCDDRIWTLASHDDGSGPALYAGGDFLVAGGTAAPHVARWDGTSWSALAGDDFGKSVRALSSFDDGNGPRLFAGGEFQRAGPTGANYVAAWDGAQWSTLGGGLGAYDAVRCVASCDLGSGEELYVGGDFNSIGERRVLRIARWTGSDWAALGAGIADGTVEAILAHDDGQGRHLFAAGVFHEAGGAQVNDIARWDGAQWSGLPGLGSHTLYALEEFDDGTGTALYAAGDIYSAGGVTTHGIGRWDGSGWSPVGSGLSSVAEALEVFDDGSGPKLYAGGFFQSAGSTVVNRIACWDGTSWEPVGGGASGPVHALRVLDFGAGPRLYAGGVFLSIGGVVARSVAFWDGVAWTPLGTGLTPLVGVDGVRSLRSFDRGTGAGPELFVAGHFDAAGGIPASNVARWDGTQWHPLDGGLSGQTPQHPVEGRAFDADVLDDGSGPPRYFVGGSFRHADLLASSSIAVWLGCVSSPGTPFCFGDGSGTACPCGNASAPGAGEGCAHSGGVGAKLVARGTSSYAANDLVFDAVNLPANKACVLFAGSQTMNGGLGVVFGAGLRCAGPSVRRLGVRVSDGGGVASWGPGLSSLALWSVGDTRHFQTWFRDPAGPCVPDTNLSSASTVSFAP
jgi:trimeric autotransporter adhesin